MDREILSNLFTDVYRRISGLPGLPWTTPEHFIENWTDCFTQIAYTPSDISIRTLLHTWDDHGRRQFFRVLESLTPPGVYPEPVNRRIQKLKAEVAGESLADSLCSLGMSGEGKQEASLGNSLGRALWDGPEGVERTELVEFEDAQRTNVPWEDDMSEDQSIVSNTGEAEQPTVSENTSFRADTLMDYSPPYVTSAVLTNLIRTAKSGTPSQPPKKEYVRCQHIRAIKKSLRQIKTNKIPGASIHKLDKSNHRQMQKWEEMKEFYYTYRHVLDPLSETTRGPLVDGKGRRGETTGDVNTAKSYNDPFVLEFFSTPVMRQYNFLFSDLVYSDCKPEELCAKMKKTRCCKGRHGPECAEKWKQMHGYVMEGMWRELEDKLRR